MRLVAEPRLCVWPNIISLDDTLLTPNLALLATSRPKGNLHDVVRFLEQGIRDAQALKDLDSATLHAVCLSDAQRPVSCFQHLEADAVPGEPNGGAEASRAA